MNETASYKNFVSRAGYQFCIGISGDFIIIFGAPYDEKGAFSGNIEEIVIDYNDYNNFIQFSRENLYEEIREIIESFFENEQTEEIMEVANYYMSLR